MPDPIKQRPAPKPLSPVGPGRDSPYACFHQDLCDNLSDGVYFVDTERQITYWNRGAEGLTGFSREEAIGRHCYNNFLMHVDEKGCALCFGGCPLAATLADGSPREGEVSLRHRRGHRVPVSVRVSPVRDSSGTIIGAVEVFRDISVQKDLERRASELETIAYQDPLTGLSNRRHIELKMHQALQEVEEFGRRAGLLLLDVDFFKRVNDRFGHACGDAVLKAVADTLLHSLRPGDSVGRWGGEEFLFLAMDVTIDSLKGIGERARTLIAACSVPVEAERVQITVSIGASLLKKGESVESALKKADELLYVGKCQGGNKVVTRR
jgi:diguanylate cyclase (GGDEF)-like protein/PAS domain S-box-containing protein